MCIPWKGKVEVSAPTLTKQHPKPRAIFQHGHAAGFQMPFLSGVCTAFCFVDEGDACVLNNGILQFHI